ncbi:DNA/RNA polymerase [Coniophora puteana RWD-64-598 SS2]|uniref:DNA-directed RNA polymerase n=1 Tax=Coniophora puteana (strain RWD-64-598) TaxID=741705 RepID=A0A5M3MDD0_CONPW|nr:DNA/RNA polymerase [Coniophora puteana RWD-64-598 SS2]EIW76844.1 DNA/RNA polymerase [Coniophora puteana RWD-64-598 SS2]
MDSPTQDQLSVMDACLHNLYDVPRAKQVFEDLRQSKGGEPLLEPRIYNSFLEAYLELAGRDPDERHQWLEEAWSLFGVMQSREESVQPTASTYATMLLAWVRYSSDPETAPKNAVNPSQLLSHIVDEEIPITSVVADRAITSSDEAASIITLLSKAAVELSLPRIVGELGQAHSAGMHEIEEDAVPQATPVRKRKATTVDGQTFDEEVPFNLDNLRKHLTQVALARRVLPEDVASRQKLLEDSAIDVAIARLQHEAKLLDDLEIGNPRLNKPKLRQWMWEWHTRLTARLTAEVREVVDAERQAGATPAPSNRKPATQIGPFLSLIKPEKLSLLVILEVMRLSGSGGVLDGMKTARALLTVGRAVENEYKAEMCKKNNIAVPQHTRFSGDVNFFSGNGYKALQAGRLAAAKYLEENEEWTSDWTQQLRVRIGGILVDCLMDVATIERQAVDKRTGEKISEQQPAFYHAYEYVRGQKLGVIRINPFVAEHLAKDGMQGTLHPRHLPMLVQPKPWVNAEQGGYIYSKSSAMRYKDSIEQQKYLQHASALGNCELVYAGLDVLGSTPWKVNEKVFDIVLQVWNSGERLGKMPPAVFDVPEPERPANVETDVKAKTVYGQRMRAWTNDKANAHSDRCSVNYKIEVARAFLGDTMYLPHNLDFRGRAYPIPPHLNHLGDDLSRGLLRFAKGKPLGVRGLRWLKIHIANLYGFDKANFDEREEFAMKYLEEIYDSAENPLTGKRWWMKADDPWQCLGACIELKAALDAPEPTAYVSHLPVHQDGTCNGLQHYAALGGDQQGAAQVNLAVTDRPSDVYTHVAKMVERRLAEDCVKGEKHAELLLGKITRKVVKQTVMTTVYGVTFVGARDQIERQLSDRKDIPEEACWAAAAYLAHITLNCIGDLFSGAKAIQNWLNLCARLISKSIPAERVASALEAPKARKGKGAKALAEGGNGGANNRIKNEQMTSVVWTTPLGLPIVQPYRKDKKKQIITSLQTVFISDPNTPAEVNTMKQASAFPPNFIHSLDATHMMLTALECRKQDITFASVHDSYWTHAASIDDMSAIIRSTFVDLHSSDILGRLRSEFEERYATHKIPVASLSSKSLIKSLQQSGVTIDPASEMARAVENTGLASLFASEGDNTVETVSEDGTAIKTTRRRRKPRAAKADADSAEAEAGAEGDAVAVSPEMSTKFVDMTAMLPPLPKKGDFDVETIKGSLYFFS